MDCFFKHIPVHRFYNLFQLRRMRCQAFRSFTQARNHNMDTSHVKQGKHSIRVNSRLLWRHQSWIARYQETDNSVLLHHYWMATYSMAGKHNPIPLINWPTYQRSSFWPPSGIESDGTGTLLVSTKTDSKAASCSSKVSAAVDPGAIVGLGNVGWCSVTFFSVVVFVPFLLPRILT